jgi:hypothetical protein
MSRHVNLIQSLLTVSAIEFVFLNSDLAPMRAWHTKKRGVEALKPLWSYVLRLGSAYPSFNATASTMNRLLMNRMTMPPQIATGLSMLSFMDRPKAISVGNARRQSETVTVIDSSFLVSVNNG